MRCRTAVAVLCLASCGYIADPLPPALNIPQPVTALTARQVGGRIKVSFLIPALTTDHIALRGVGGVELRFNDQTIPVAASEPGPVQLDVPVDGWIGKHVTLSVRVASRKERWSAAVTGGIDVIAPLAPPGSPRAESGPRGVKLTWQSGGAQTVIYRNREEIAKVEGGEWIDAAAKFGERYEYVLQTAQQSALSDPTDTLAITPEDKFPPSVPANLTAVQGINAVELTWDRSPEPDTAGYRLYRAESAGPLKPLGDLNVTASFSDRAVTSGVSYRYAVSAVDRKGNESALSAAVEVVAP